MTRSPSPEAPQPDWEQLSAGWREELEAFYRDRNVPPKARETTVRTNTTLVPRRGDSLLRMLAELGSLPTIEGLRVLEAGCGFGSLAAYLAWRGRAREVVAIDVSRAYLEVASAALARSAAMLSGRLRYEHADMADLAPYANGSFDVIVANNSFIYITDRSAAERALREFHRVLKGGGLLVLYHANKWRLREPFTGDPLVHLLPRLLAEPLCRVTGWRHNHGRVRLVSPVALRRALRRAGFEHLATEGFARGSHRSWPRRDFGSFYAMVARRPW